MNMRTAHIVITGHVAGRTWLYENLGRQGRKILVPTYRANLTRSDGSLFWFAITRDSAEVIFRGLKNRYGSLGECPPNKTCSPYYGTRHNAPRNGICLLLSEGVDAGGRYLVGQGKIKRRVILIHAGPSSSLGCMSVAGGKQRWKAFWCEVKMLFVGNPDIEIRVHVEPR